MKRRTFVRGCLAMPLIFAGCQPDDMPEVASVPEANESLLEKPADEPELNKKRETAMYGLISKMSATEGKRDQLIKILLDGTKDMPGCRLYAVSADSADQNSVWVTEIWDSEQSHQDSLQLPSVQNAIATGKPLIASFDARHIVNPVGGIGV